MAVAQPIQNGRADLTEWSRYRITESVSLEGDWDFHWEHLYDPEEVKTVPVTEHLKVPAAWTSWHKSFGYGTYRAQIKVAVEDDYGLFISGISSATRLWVNGKLLFEAGTVSTDSRTHKPSRKMGVIQLPPATHYDIVIWVSNYEHVNGGIKIPLRFGLYKGLAADIQRHTLLDAFVIAAIFAIGLFHLVTAMIRSDIIPLSLALLCFTISVRASFTGMRVIDAFFDIPFLVSYKIEYVSFYLVGTLCELSIMFLFYQDYPKKLLPFRIACHALIYPLLFTSLFIMSKYLWIVSIHSLGIIGFGMYTLLQAVRRKRVGAGWLFKGAIFFSAIATFDIIQSLMVERKYIYFLPLGFIGFILSFSASIAQIYNNIQKTMLDAVESKHHTLDQLKKIVYPHQIEMIGDGEPIEKTMPTSQGEACVISFDIISSSKIQHEKAKEFFRKVFMRCSEIMMEGYDGVELKAAAYRIKEMGDGFLCSVGYPFKSLTGHMAQDALKLAQEFARIFHEEARRLEYPDLLSCGVGLALESIEGFYPASGTKEYDLYGKAIVLATRYEGMRKAIVKEDEQSSIIILQERVYFSLSPEQRQSFQLFDLEAAKAAVRDDPAAKRLYFLKLFDSATVESPDLSEKKAS
ncbi:7TM-DISM domain-containing protein [Oligoflexus tunisiensis]|uniref:7TM-DISM domain-containing protein n=1 Tax=Oligoflexus tunisiensis TaxID=708132 RepID=UPI001C40318B|nr:7TM-DISM domain-containing protein [Oligoflexus tunisiensis]